MITVRDLFKGIKYSLKNIDPDFEIAGISGNSRTLKKNELFIAVKGYERDGHEFISEAVKKGASCVCSTKTAAGLNGAKYIIVEDTGKILPILASRFNGEPSKKLNFIGITGTNGKTTTSYLIYEILQKAEKSPALLGTINNRIKDSVIASTNTTPGPLELHSLLKDMKAAGTGYVVMEVSSHALKQDRVSGIDFKVAVMTNITGDHLDYHKTMKDYIKSKKILFESLKKDAVAVLNTDDISYNDFKKSTKANILSYGIKKKADFMARDISSDVNGSRFSLVTPNGIINAGTKIIGRHNIYNILASVASCFSEGIGFDTMRDVIEYFNLVPGRLESVDAGQRFKVFVDYAHTHDALKNVLSELRKLSNGKLIAVFGCGGNRDRTKRPKMGRIASELADYVILTNDNPRKEDPGLILDNIEKGFTRNFKSYQRIPDRLEAIKTAIRDRNPSDIVVIAGKGHEDYQIIGEKTFPFNDRRTIEEILSKQCLR